MGVARDAEQAEPSEEDAELEERFPDETRRRAAPPPGQDPLRRLRATGCSAARELPGKAAIRSVRVEGRERPITEGMAYVHFFPGGQAERAFVEVAEGDHLYTVVVEPFTGRARVVTGAVEADR